MIGHHASSVRRRSTAILGASLVLAAALGTAQAARAQCPPTVPVQGAPPPGPLPVFPPDNGWNQDVSSAPVDPSSASYIAFINGGGTRALHPDFGGEASPGSVTIYGMPYAVVDATQPKQAVTFQYWQESDGVDPSTGAGVPFYPIPPQAITEPHWVEGGAPGNVDERSQADRHLLMIDCTNRYLYELYNVYYDSARGRWFAGSGAFFDMSTNDRRPEGWTSADASGLAIFPGLVRYDEAWNPGVTDIGHAFRVTVRATNGYVYPASHAAGSTPGAPPLGTRLRLKATVNGSDPALRTSDPNVQKIFRAMQKYGLIVADNGADMFVTGTFDPRWNNDILNPAFALLSANDFEVVELGWQPQAGPVAPALGSVAASPAAVVGGEPSEGTVTLTSAAPPEGAVVTLASSSAAAAVPASIAVAAGATSAAFPIATSPVSASTSATISATFAGVSKTTTLTVLPPGAASTLGSLTLDPTTVVGGASSTGTVTLTAPAPPGGAIVALATSMPSLASVPAAVTVAEGATSATFPVATTAPRRRRAGVTISATYDGATASARLGVTR